MPQSKVRLGLLAFVRIVAALLWGSAKRKPILLMDNEANVRNVRPGPYVKTNGQGSYRLLYSPDRKRLAKGLLMCFAVFKAYVAKRRAAAGRWCQDIGKLRSGDRWKGVFAG